MSEMDLSAAPGNAYGSTWSFQRIAITHDDLAGPAALSTPPRSPGDVRLQWYFEEHHRRPAQELGA
jgi:hypothetical protein